MTQTKKDLASKKAKDGSIRPVLSIEPDESVNNNNFSKDMALFIDCIEKFSDIEIKFILMQLNRDNMMGRKVTRVELKDIEQEFILKVISNSPVSDYGALLKNIIQIKLLNII
jgi:hypothetical protein